MLELRRETIEVLREEVQGQNWLNKLKGKAYADARRDATPKSIRIGDTATERERVNMSC